MMDAKQSAFSVRMWTVLKFVPAFCMALLVSGCDGSNSSPVGISTELNEEGYKIRRLTDDLGDDESPSWSPDGRSIAFSARSRRHQRGHLHDGCGRRQRASPDQPP